jgi:hypothetical protein
MRCSEEPIVVGKPLGVIGLMVALMGCGGEEVPPPAVATTVPAVVQDTTPAAVADSQSTELLREVFSYRGSGRDPFQSLVRRGGEVRPFLEDLRLVSIAYDLQYPTRSVAILRDRTDGKRYDVRVDDQLGRMRVTEIRPGEVVFTIEDFGVPRQVVLTVRRPGN